MHNISAQNWTWDAALPFNGNGLHQKVVADPYLNIYYYNNYNGNYFSKYSSTGVFQWMYSFPANVSIRNITCSGDSSIYVTGTYYGVQYIDSSVLINQGGADIFIARFTPNGNLDWINQIGGMDSDFAGDLCMNGTDVMLTGAVTYTAYYSSQQHAGTSQPYLFICRYKNSGQLDTIAFADNLPSPNSSNSQGFEIETDQAGNYYLLGRFRGSVQLGASIFSGNNINLLIKLDGQFNTQWTDSISSTNYYWMHSLVVDRLNNPIFLDQRDPQWTYSILHKYSPSGVQVFSLQCPSFTGPVLSPPYLNRKGELQALALDSCNNIYFTGYALQNYFIPVSNGPPTPVNEYHLLTGQVSPSGSLNWCRNDTAHLFRYGSGIVCLGLNKLYVSGGFVTQLTLNSSLTSSVANNFHAILQHTFGLPTNVTPPPNQNICENQSINLTCNTGGSISWYNNPTTFTSLASGPNFTSSPLPAGSYTWFAEANTCTTTSGRLPVIVIVNALPLITASGGSVCLGKSLDLNPGGGVIYTCVPGGPVVSPGVTSTYTIIGTNSSACSNSTTAQVTVLPGPLITFTSSKDQICAGETVTLNAAGASSYSWNLSAGSNQLVITPSVSSTYLIIGADQQGCSTSTLVTQLVNKCTSISVERPDDISVSPIPSSGTFLIQGLQDCTIEVYSTTGQVLITAHILQESETLSLTHLEPGVYHLRASTHATFKHFKLIIEK